MAQQAHPSVFSPEDLADESLFDDEEPLTRPGVARPRVVAPRSRTQSRVEKNNAEAEAIAIANELARKVAVARSLFRIASSAVRSYADQKMAEIVEQDAGNAMAHVARARQVATAAKEAAKHAASLAAARAAARAQEAMEALELLDPEAAHDDAC